MKYFLIMWLLAPTPASVQATVPLPYKDLVACQYAGSVWKSNGTWTQPRNFECVPHE